MAFGRGGGGETYLAKGLLPTLGGGGASLQGHITIPASKAGMGPQRPMWALRGQCVTPKGKSWAPREQNRAISGRFRDLIGWLGPIETNLGPSEASVGPQVSV